MRAARSTVVGMSCSLRSRNTGAWSRTAATASGPWAANSSRPTLSQPTSPASAAARSRGLVEGGDVERDDDALACGTGHVGHQGTTCTVVGGRETDGRAARASGAGRR